MTIEQGGHRRPGEAQETTDTAQDRPLVSVVVTTYNRPSYLQDAVESVREQTYDPVELVVVDDHSRTPAREALADLDLTGFRNVQCIRHEENRGANAARNTGIAAASGEYIAFLDDDDQWVPEKLDRQVAAFEADDDVGVVYAGARTRSEGDSWTELPPPVEGDITKALLCRNVVGTLSTVMVRADVAREVPLDEGFPTWADLEWYINLSTMTTFKRIPEPLVVYEFTSHNRLSDDFEKKRETCDLFMAEFDGLASQYGRLFRRKMHGWAAYRAGRAALNNRRYDQARQLLASALIWYPLEPTFLQYFLATVGGRYTHGLARGLNRLVSSVTSAL